MGTAGEQGVKKDNSRSRRGKTLSFIKSIPSKTRKIWNKFNKASQTLLTVIGILVTVVACLVSTYIGILQLRATQKSSQPETKTYVPTLCCPTPASTSTPITISISIITPVPFVTQSSSPAATPLSSPAPTSTFMPGAALLSTPSPTSPAGPYFNVYTDASAPDNHFIASGYMGDIADLKINTAWSGVSHTGETSIKVVYNPYDEPGEEHYCHPKDSPLPTPCKWAGLYWLWPADNTGQICGVGYNLSNFKKLTLWARSDQPVNVRFQVGGAGKGYEICPDSFGPTPAGTWWLRLDTEWKSFEINLTGEDLSYVIGGFSFFVERDNNQLDPGSPPITFYLDDIRYER